MRRKILAHRSKRRTTNATLKDILPDREVDPQLLLFSDEPDEPTPEPKIEPTGKKPPMEFVKHMRKPFEVSALKITRENIAEVAPLIGFLKYDEQDGKPYILVDNDKVPNLERVFPGFYITKMGRNVRCYSSKIFQDQFVEKTEEMQSLLDQIRSTEDAANGV